MPTLLAPQPESLWDEVFAGRGEGAAGRSGGVGLCCWPISELLWPLVERWQRELRETGRLVLTEGWPTIAMETMYE